jgi:hypothetical protein
MTVILIVKEGGYEAKNGQILNKLPPLVSYHRKHNIVIDKLQLTAYSENISSLTESLKLFITDDTPNEMCHHTNVDASSRIPNLWKEISSEERFAFLGLCIVSGVLKTRKEPVTMLWTAKAAYARFFMQQWQGIGSFKFYMSFLLMTKLKEINGDQQMN